MAPPSPSLRRLAAGHVALEVREAAIERLEAAVAIRLDGAQLGADGADVLGGDRPRRLAVRRIPGADEEGTNDAERDPKSLPGHGRSLLGDRDSLRDLFERQQRNEIGLISGTCRNGL